MKNWTSVKEKDRLPEYSKPIFTLDNDNVVSVGIRERTDVSGEKYIVFRHYDDNGDEIFSKSKTTHWMPIDLPEPPKE